MSKLIFVPIGFFLSLNVFATELALIEVEASKDIERFTFSDSFSIPIRELESTPLVAPAIEKVPGIVSNQNGGPGGRVSFFIRGTESRHVSFTLDSLKINDASNVDRQFDAAFMTSAYLRNVVVHKGPQAVLYGSDAMGGIVELTTRKGEEAPETRLLLNTGSFGTLGATLSSDWKSRNQTGTLTFTRFHTDGISRLNQKRFNATEQDSADITQLTSSSRHRLSEKIQTDFLASYIHGTAQMDAFGKDTRNDYSLDDQYIVQQKTNFDLSKSEALSLRNGLSRHQRFIHSEGTDDLTYGSNLYQNELLYRKESRDYGILAGTSNEHETNHSSSINKSFDLNSVFFQGLYKKEQFQVQSGLRSDHHSRYGGFLTGSSGVSYSFFDQEVSLQYSQGFKAPSLYQLYGPATFGYPVGNKNLVPERNHSWEGSWKFKKKFIDGGLTFFQNRLSNLITYTNQGYINQGKFVVEGLELFTNIKLKSFNVSPSFTHQNFLHETSAVLRRPQNMGKMSVSYFPAETWELNVTERWFDARKDKDLNGNIVKLNGFAVLDIGATKTWEKDDLGLQIKNVLNRDYEELYGYSVLPLSVFANYGHRF